MTNIELYFYFNLTKPGKYSYEGFNFSMLYEPTYVGIGSFERKRHKVHFDNAKYLLNKNYTYKSEKFRKRDQNYPKLIFIRKLIEEHNFKLDDMCFVLRNDLDRDEAKQLEIEYITKIGRQIDDKGPLLNYTLGGDGGLGKKWTEEQKKAKSESMKGEKNHMFGRREEKSPIYGIIRTEEAKKKYSESKMGPKNPQFGKPSWNKGSHWDENAKNFLF